MRLLINKENSIIDILNYYHLSKPKIYDLRINKKITIDGNAVNFEKVFDEDTYVDIDIEEELNYECEEGFLDIIYEDEDFLAVSKKPKMIIHDTKHSLANIVANYYAKNSIKTEIRFPSRIDSDTTGIVLFAKNILSASYIDYLFRENLVHKEYLALVYNRFKKLDGSMNYRIGTDRHVNGKMVICANGKDALTEYKVLKNGSISLALVRIKTGRTHQIRVHMAKINHPLLGDNLYGSSPYDRVMLHAYKLEFVHPKTKELLKIEAKIPEDMQTIIDKIFND